MRAPRWMGTVAGWLGDLSSRDRRAILIGAVILIPALGWVGLVRPYLGAASELRDRLAAEEALLEREQRILEEAPGLPDLLGAAGGELTRLEGRLIRAENPALAEAAVSGLLERLARQNLVFLQEVRSITGTSRSSVPQALIPIYLSVSGESDFEGVLDFINTIERERLLMEISLISIGTTSSSGEEPVQAQARPGSGVMSFTAVVLAYMAGPA